MDHVSWEPRSQDLYPGLGGGVGRQKALFPPPSQGKVPGNEVAGFRGEIFVGVDILSAILILA